MEVFETVLFWVAYAAAAAAGAFMLCHWFWAMWNATNPHPKGRNLAGKWVRVIRRHWKATLVGVFVFALCVWHFIQAVPRG